MSPKHTQNVQVRIDVKDLATITGWVNSKQTKGTVFPKGTCLRIACGVLAQDYLRDKYAYVENDEDAIKLLEKAYGNGKVDSDSIIADMTGSGRGGGA